MNCDEQPLRKGYHLWGLAKALGNPSASRIAGKIQMGHNGNPSEALVRGE